VPTEGRYLLDGTDVSRMTDDELAEIRNRKIGLVFQSYNLLPRTTALANVELPLVYGNQRARRTRALRALEEVGLAVRAGLLRNRLSGGELRRAPVALEQVTRTKMILGDETTGNLDTEASHEIARMLGRLSQAGRTVVLITHE